MDEQFLEEMTLEVSVKGQMGGRGESEEVCSRHETSSQHLVKTM